MDDFAIIADNALQNMLLLRKCTNVSVSASNLQNFNAIALCLPPKLDQDRPKHRGKHKRKFYRFAKI